MKIEALGNAIGSCIEMKVLALECATERRSVALWIDGEVHSLHSDGQQQRNSESLLPMVSALLKEADSQLQALDVIAFGAGPGAFTGLRVACGVAQGLAFGAGLPVIAVGTMDTLAEGMRMYLASQGETQQEPIRVFTVLDARMGEVYAAELIQLGQDWHSLCDPHLSRPESLKLEDHGAYLGVGNGFALYPELLTNRLGPRLKWMDACLQVPDAVPLAQLAAYRYQKQGGTDPEQAQPMYVRDKVALTSAERAKT